MDDSLAEAEEHQIGFSDHAAKTLLSRATSPLLDPVNIEASVSASSLLSLSTDNTVNHNSLSPGKHVESFVNVKLCYAPVWKSSFQNRRFQSNHLKQSFPAGFRLQALRSQLAKDPRETMLRRAEGSTGTTGLNASTSFVDWTKGGSGSHSQSWTMDEHENEHDDPFADCAGPSMTEIQRARRGLKDVAFDFVVNDPACVVRRAPVTHLPVCTFVSVFQCFSDCNHC
jgi:hypothetical protein